jgi:hypothetical protein
MLSGLKPGLGAGALLDFDLVWFAQTRLAYAIESHLLCDAHDAVGTNLGVQNSDYNRYSHSGIWFSAYLGKKVRQGGGEGEAIGFSMQLTVQLMSI